MRADRTAAGGDGPARALRLHRWHVDARAELLVGCRAADLVAAIVRADRRRLEAPLERRPVEPRREGDAR